MTQADKNSADKDLMVKLSDSNLTLSDPKMDIRGSAVVDRHGDDIGHVNDLFIDTDENKVRLMEVGAGGFLGLGERHFLVPVDAITRVEQGKIHINQARDHVVASPAYDPNVTPEQRRSSAFWEPYYGYYGMGPYWGAGYSYPGFPMY